MAYYGHVSWIAAKNGYVLLQPVQGRYLIHQSVVGRRFQIRIRIGIKEAWNKKIFLLIGVVQIAGVNQNSAWVIYKSRSSFILNINKEFRKISFSVQIALGNRQIFVSSKYCDEFYLFLARIDLRL